MNYRAGSQSFFGQTQIYLCGNSLDETSFNIIFSMHSQLGVILIANLDWYHISARRAFFASFGSNCGNRIGSFPSDLISSQLAWSRPTTLSTIVGSPLYLQSGSQPNLLAPGSDFQIWIPDSFGNLTTLRYLLVNCCQKEVETCSAIFKASNFKLNISFLNVT